MNLMSKTIKRVKSGRLVSAVLYSMPSPGDSPKVRQQKQKTSSLAREKLNARTSFQKLERTLAANFSDGDVYLTLTYDDKHLPDSRSKAVRRIRSFLSKLRAERKKRKETLKYIYVTEGNHPGGRLHHHVVLNGTGKDLQEIRQLWIYGENVEIRRLKFHRDYTYEDLASYLTKEPRDWGHPKVGERTWTPSVGLAKPVVETETVSDYLTLTAPPEAIILAKEGPVMTVFGEFTWIKYLLPEIPKKTKRARRQRKKE